MSLIGYSLQDNQTGFKMNQFIYINSTQQLVKDLQNYKEDFIPSQFWLTPKKIKIPFSLSAEVGLIVKTNFQCDLSAFDTQYQYAYNLDLQQDTKCITIPVSAVAKYPGEDLSGSDYTVEALECAGNGQVFNSRAAPKLEMSQICLDDTYTEERVDEFFIKVVKQNSYLTFKHIKLYPLKSQSLEISFTMTEFSQSFMNMGSPYQIKVSELLDFLVIQQSVYQVEGLVFTKTVEPQLYFHPKGTKTKVEFNSPELFFEGEYLKLRKQKAGSYSVFIKYQAMNEDFYLPLKAYVCAFEPFESLRPLVLEYTVAWYIEDTSHTEQQMMHLFESSIDGCQIVEISLVKDETGAPLDESSGLGLIQYNALTDFLVIVRNDKIGDFSLMAQAKNAENLTAHYPLRLKLMPSVNKMPTLSEELEQFEVTVQQIDQIEGRVKTIDFKSPLFNDPEGDNILLTITGHENNQAIDCEPKINFFVCLIDTNKVTLENSGTQEIQITASDDGSNIGEPPTIIDFAITINYIEHDIDQEQDLNSEVQSVIAEELTPKNAHEEAIMKAALDAEKEAEKKAAEQKKKAADDAEDKARDKDEVITERIPAIGPSKPPNIEYIGIAQTALLMDRLKIQNEKAKIKKLQLLKKQGKEPRPVKIQHTQMSKQGLVEIDFNQPIEVPSIFKTSSGQGRRLLALENIDPSTIINFNMHLLSGASPRDLSYYMVFKEWNENRIAIQVDFNNPLMLSQGPATDKMSIKISKPELFVSKESGEALDLNDERAQLGSIISIPNQLPKEVVEKVIETTAVYGSRGATAIVVAQILSQSLLKGSLKDFDELIFNLQAIALYPYYTVDIPPNVLIYIDQIRVLVNLESLKPEYLLKLYDKDLTMEKLSSKLYPDRPFIPKSLENSGSSGNIWQDLSTIIVAVIFFLLFILILAAIKKFCSCNRRLRDFANKQIESQKERWLYNGMIQAYSFSFLLQTGAVGSKIIQMSQMDDVEVSSRLGVIFMMCLLVTYLVVIFGISWCVRYRRKVTKDMSEFKEVYSIMNQIDFTINRHNHEQQKDGLPHYMHFVWLLKRFLFAMIPAIFINMGGVQTILLVLLNQVYTMYIAYTLPNVDFYQNLRNILSEILQMAIIYHIVLFSDFVPEVEMKYSIGCSALVFIGLLSAFNLGVIMAKVVDNFKRRKLIEKKRRQLAILEDKYSSKNFYDPKERKYLREGLKESLLRLGVDIDKERNGGQEKEVDKYEKYRAKARELLDKETQEKIKDDAIKRIISNDDAQREAREKTKDKAIRRIIDDGPIKDSSKKRPGSQRSQQDDEEQGNVILKTKESSKNRLNKLYEKDEDKRSKLKKQISLDIVSAKSKSAINNTKLGNNVSPLKYKRIGLNTNGTVLDTVKEEMETSMIETARDQQQSSQFTKKTPVKENLIFAVPKGQRSSNSEWEELKKKAGKKDLISERDRLLKIQEELKKKNK